MSYSRRIMKFQTFGIAVWFGWLGASAAQTPLPEGAPGRFAPVPAKITSGPALPAAPLEDKAPVFADCGNASAMLENLRLKLSAEQLKLLDTQRFLLIPIEATTLAEALPTSDDEKESAFSHDEMLGAFARFGGSDEVALRKPFNTRLITPDVVLHAWHCGFSRALEAIERRRLHAMLTTFLTDALTNARALRGASSGAAADRLAWTEARFAAPWILLGLPDPLPSEPARDDDGNLLKKPEPKPYAEVVKNRLTQACKQLPEAPATALKQEIALVLAAEGFAKSPLFGQYAPDKPADYSQFKPRSHYTKSAALGGYFRAMMFLGRNGYQLTTPEAIGDATLAALVMARTPDKKKSAPLATWQKLMEITGFFAGQSDDITYPELIAWLKATLGTAALDPATAISEKSTAKLAAELTKLRPPLLVSAPHADQLTSPDSDPPSFRICGQRFSWDARVFDRFTRGSPDAMPSVPTAVMIPAAFGDPLAEKISRDFLGNNPTYLAEFDQRLPAIRKELAAVSDAEFFSSMAAKQLHVIATLARPRNENFPAFMSNDAFRAKNIASMLGSYTELKHDTVLYAKQIYAEMGEGGASDRKPPPPPHGFVQPDVAFWREMERLVRFTEAGFARHQLFPDSGEEFSRFGMFANGIERFRVIAEKHVAGTPLTDADWETIRTSDLSYMAEPLGSNEYAEPGDGMCALVTDVLTDAGEGRILCEALGRPLVMLALVGGKDGNRMVAGLAYNHFEFIQPLADGRLTDKEWQAKIYIPNPKLPARPSWNAPVTVPATLPRADD